MILLPGRFAESIGILSPCRPLSKSTVSATFVAALLRKGQRISELLACFNQLQGLDLDVVSQHQLFGVRMEVHVLRYPGGARYRHPVGNRVAVHGDASYWLCSLAEAAPQDLRRLLQLSSDGVRVLLLSPLPVVLDEAQELQTCHR